MNSRQPFKGRDIGAGVLEEVSSRESLFFFFLVLFFKMRNSRILLLKCGLGSNLSGTYIGESVKVKVLIDRLCLTLCDPMDCSLPGFSVHGILQARILGVSCYFLPQGIFPTQGSNPGLLHCRWTLPSEPPGKPIHGSTV